ncbi:diacylglycerol/lipid kinase family protein [Halococcus agarilyticus]|uniref:diacylglycerol/lipid kinase family protein n=1 Tax=Halococcus agarilyticus TaxID=1232219 RepID=UPI0006780E31|nr:YegS/Rv2252/BmrU family lipid kinase [Halococcus agarilyticus]
MKPPTTVRTDGGASTDDLERRVVVNPESGSGDHLDTVYGLADERGYTVHETVEAGHAADLAREAAADGVSVLGACGGDGTLKEVIEGLVAAEALDDVRLGVIPAGTANIVATDLGIEGIEHGFAMLDTGKVRNIDLGVADGEPFVKSCVAGLTADASAATTSDVKERFGPLAFVITGVQQATTFDPLDVTIDAVADGETWSWSGEALCVLVGNSRRFTNRIGQANVEDGLFDVTVIEEMPQSDRVAEAIGQQLLGRDTEHVDRFFARRLRIVGHDRPIDFSLDGEISTHDELDLQVRPGALRMAVGPEYDPDPTD